MRGIVFLFHKRRASQKILATITSTEKFLAAKTDAFAHGSACPNTDTRSSKPCSPPVAKPTPVNPALDEIEGHRESPSISDLPLVPEASSIITPDKVTRRFAIVATAAGVKRIWMHATWHQYSTLISLCWGPLATVFL
ncbi:CoA-binding protein [Novipirellula galeiformis]|uniref:CoA-binding protein n=1 Tax=Novipirellula galeiformis TaxID=2528004 RepID=UPI001E58C1B3|nr:CoA-binding protein [Novipirellula galeiformis]